MTENKRFKRISVCGDWGIKDVHNDKVLFFATTDEVDDTWEVLNELHEENKELKEGVEEFNEICKYYEMRIKELSEQADAVRTELQLCEEENTELQKENEQLKFQNSNLMKEVAEYSRKIKELTK